MMGSTESVPLALGDLSSQLSNRFAAELPYAYTRAWERAYQGYPEPQAHDLVGHLRFAECEALLARVASQLSGLVVEIPTNGKNYSHVRVLSNEWVVTQHVVNGIRAMPRPAVYRGLYSGGNFVLPGFEPALTQMSEPRHCALLHAPDPRDVAVPAFLQAVIPVGTTSDQVLRIDLSDAIGIDSDVDSAKSIIEISPVGVVLNALAKRISWLANRDRDAGA